MTTREEILAMAREAGFEAGDSPLLSCYSTKLDRFYHLAQSAAYEAGWRTAANWMGRDDLHADIGSPAYEADKRKALKEQA